MKGFDVGIHVRRLRWDAFMCDDLSFTKLTKCLTDKLGSVIGTDDGLGRSRHYSRSQSRHHSFAYVLSFAVRADMVPDDATVVNVDDVCDVEELSVAVHVPVLNVELPELIGTRYRMIASQTSGIVNLLASLRMENAQLLAEPIHFFLLMTSWYCTRKHSVNNK
jgi:hypothetical protein